MKRDRLTLVFALIAATGSAAGIAAVASRHADPVVNAAGKLRVPADYRTTYQYIGTWAVAADAGQGAKEMHIVYASPGSVPAYRRTGQFPDGTVLVKEVQEAQTSPMTTGIVSHPSKVKGWFVMVKDSKNSHRHDPLWGDGWGWSWFGAGDPIHTTSTEYKNDCQSCHLPAKGTDWIYINGYGALRK